MITSLMGYSLGVLSNSREEGGGGTGRIEEKNIICIVL